MTFFTLQPAGGAEKCLADWGISRPIREVSNQAADHFAFDLNAATDGTDLFPYGTQIILRLGRTPASGTAVSNAGLPLSGNTAWTGGQTWFVGWRVDNFRTGSADVEKLDYKFAGPWEFFFERLVFRKIRFSYNGVANVAVYQDRITLGLSVNALIGAGDTIPDTDATNLMSIAQQVKEIAAYAITQSATAYAAGQFTSITAGAQFQFDALTADDEGNYQLYESPGPNCNIPDYITGYSVGGFTSATANLETVLRAPLDTVTSITCAEAMRKMCRWIGPFGSPVLWFDYTTSPPTLHINTRDALPAVTLPYPVAGAAQPISGAGGPFYVASTRIKRRDDLIPSCVAIDFSITGTWDGFQYCQTIRDVAGSIAGTMYEGVGATGALYTLGSAFGGSPAYLGGSAGSALANELEQLSFGFEGQTTTIDMEGQNASISYCTIATLDVALGDPSGGGAALAFWKTCFPEMAQETSPAFATGAAPVTVTDDAGNAMDISTNLFSGDTAVYQYLLTDGQIAPWMLAGNVTGGAGAKSRQCTVTATFSHTKNNIVDVSGTPTNAPMVHAQNQPKNARITLVSIPGGAYSKQQIVAGEVIPYGLAGYIYNIEKIPQYEGTFTIIETEITDQVPLGNNLNLSGSLAEWAAMAACVQQINYDLDAGKTTLIFGPAAHLGAKDFVERLRINRPPRWYNLQNQNPTNNANAQSGTQLGNNLPQRGPNNGPVAADWQLFPISVTDQASHSYPIGAPGIHIDTRTTGQFAYGQVTSSPIAAAITAGQIPASPTKPTIHLQDGAAGAYSGHGCVRISVADIATQQVWLQEQTICYDFGDGAGPVPAYAIFLMSKPYTTSIY